MSERVDKALAKLNKDLGTGTIGRLGDNPEWGKVEAISTGSLLFDLATGIRGLPRGRIIEFYGPESSGKTTAALHALAETQKAGFLAAVVDAEHTLDREYAAKLGIDVDNLYVSQPDYGEQALDVVVALCGTGEFGAILIDSVAALTPKKEIEGAMGDSTIGLQARMMGQAMRKLTAIAERTGTTLIFINQLREKIGVMFGSPETTAGGNALKFYASMRVDFRKSVDLVAEANTTTIKIVKNKVAPPFHKVKVDILWGVGYDSAKELLGLAVDMEVVKKGGAWYTVEQDKIQGEDKMMELLADNPEFYENILVKVKEKIANGYQLVREPPKEK